MVKSRWVGTTLVYYEDYEYRWLDAIGPDVRKWEMRIGTNWTTAAEYTVTAVGTSPVVQAITAGDRVLITTGGTENHGANIQVIGTPFALATGRPLYFGAKASISDATQSDFFVGLASTDTTIIAAHDITLVDDGVYFYKLDEGTVIRAAAEKAGAVSVVSAAAAMTTTKRLYEIFWDGAGSLAFYLDGVLVTNMASAAAPTVVITPSVVLQTGEAVAKTGLVEWMRCIQL